MSVFFLKCLKVSAISGCCLATMPVLATLDNRPSVDIVPVLTSLLVVVAAIVVLAVFYKRMNLGFPGSRAIKVVTALSLGNKERIVVIEVNGQQHLIGVTSQQVNHLLSLDEPLNMDSPTPAGAMSFQSILQGITKKHD
jgi:flagellar biosynthetic protein FliO